MVVGQLIIATFRQLLREREARQVSRKLKGCGHVLRRQLGRALR